MFRTLLLIKFTSIASILISVSAALGQPEPETLILSSVPSAESDSTCYMRRPDGTIIELDAICGRTPRRSPNRSPEVNSYQDGGVDIHSPEYQRSMEILRQQRQRLPNRNTVIRAVCRSWGRCPTPSEIERMSIGRN